MLDEFYGNGFSDSSSRRLEEIDRGVEEAEAIVLSLKPRLDALGIGVEVEPEMGQGPADYEKLDYLFSMPGLQIQDSQTGEPDDYRYLVELGCVFLVITFSLKDAQPPVQPGLYYSVDPRMKASINLVNETLESRGWVVNPKTRAGIALEDDIRSNPRLVQALGWDPDVPGRAPRPPKRFVSVAKFMISSSSSSITA